MYDAPHFIDSYSTLIIHSHIEIHSYPYRQCIKTSIYTFTCSHTCICHRLIYSKTHLVVNTFTLMIFILHIHIDKPTCRSLPDCHDQVAFIFFIIAD